MNLLGRLTYVRLRWHLLLSIPCALAGVLVALVLFMAWLSRPSSEAFPMAAANWGVMSAWSVYAALMLANTWRTCGLEGLRSQMTWVNALPVVSAFQAAAALAMLFTVIGWSPAVLLYVPFVIAFGAPWASLSWQLLRLSRVETTDGPSRLPD